MGFFTVTIKGPTRTSSEERRAFEDAVRTSIYEIDPMMVYQTLGHRLGYTPTATFMVEAESPAHALYGVFNMLPASVLLSLTDYSSRTIDRGHGWTGQPLRVAR